MEKIFFENWNSLLRIFIITVFGYVAMILFLRISGKRTLSKMNAFDFVITIALGSSLATVALNKQVPLLNGILAFALLILLQFIITWTSLRIPLLKRMVTSRPALLLFRGELLEEVLRKERITKEEIYMALRQKGLTHPSEADAIVLETTGTLTVIPEIRHDHPEALENVVYYESDKEEAVN